MRYTVATSLHFFDNLTVTKPQRTVLTSSGSQQQSSKFLPHSARSWEMLILIWSGHVREKCCLAVVAFESIAYFRFYQALYNFLKPNWRPDITFVSTKLGKNFWTLFMVVRNLEVIWIISIAIFTFVTRITFERAWVCHRHHGGPDQLEKNYLWLFLVHGPFNFD